MCVCVDIHTHTPQKEKGWLCLESLYLKEKNDFNEMSVQSRKIEPHKLRKTTTWQHYLYVTTLLSVNYVCCVLLLLFEE